MGEQKVHQKGMFLLNKIFKNSQGITLVEVLASITLFTIISVLAVNIFVKASETANNIQTDTELRDEADVIMSRFIKIIYSTNQNTIVRNITNENDSYIEITNDLSKCHKDENENWIIDTECKNTLKKVGFQTTGNITRILFKDENYQINNNDIRISPESKINGDPESTTFYEIYLVLEKKTKQGNQTIQKKMIFKNNIQPLFSNGN